MTTARRAQRQGALLACIVLASSHASSFSQEWAQFQRRRGVGWLQEVQPVFTSAEELVETVVIAMQAAPVSEASALFLKLSTPGFRLIGITPWSATSLAIAVSDPSSQYHLLVDDRLGVVFPSEPVFWEDGALERCWLEVALELSFEGDPHGFTAAKLGWECERPAAMASDLQGWRTSSITWHDFRPDFTPGLGQEDWPRICG